MKEYDIEHEVLKTAADVASIEVVHSYIEEKLEADTVATALIYKMAVAVDEIYSNIVNYSGADYAAVVCDVTEDEIRVVFRDNGTSYNPLEKDDPDITASAEDRDIGGLGIFMAKKLMSDISYSYADGCNELTLKLNR